MLITCKCMTLYKKLHYDTKNKPPYFITTLHPTQVPTFLFSPSFCYHPLHHLLPTYHVITIIDLMWPAPHHHQNSHDPILWFPIFVCHDLPQHLLPSTCTMPTYASTFVCLLATNKQSTSSLLSFFWFCTFTWNSTRYAHCCLLCFVFCPLVFVRCGDDEQYAHHHPFVGLLFLCLYEM